MESVRDNKFFEQTEQVEQPEEAKPVERAESITSETSFTASTSSHKMKIDELTSEEPEHAMEVDFVSSSAKPNSNNKFLLIPVIYHSCISILRRSIKHFLCY